MIRRECGAFNEGVAPPVVIVRKQPDAVVEVEGVSLCVGQAGLG